MADVAAVCSGRGYDGAVIHGVAPVRPTAAMTRYIGTGASVRSKSVFKEYAAAWLNIVGPIGMVGGVGDCVSRGGRTEVAFVAGKTTMISMAVRLGRAAGIGRRIGVAAVAAEGSGGAPIRGSIVRHNCSRHRGPVAVTVKV